MTSSSLVIRGATHIKVSRAEMLTTQLETFCSNHYGMHFAKCFPDRLAVFVLFCLFVCFLFCFVVFLFCFLVCEQLLKAIVDPLVVKTTKVLDLAHEKERVALWCS